MRLESYFEDTLIVLTSDHGESLGEHGEETHGYFIYESTLRVPLILRWPAGCAAVPGARRRACQPARRGSRPCWIFWGSPRRLNFRGTALSDCCVRILAESEPVYAESMYARDHLACSPLRSIRVGRYKYIEAPKPELYDLASDPGETQNRYDRIVTVALDLKARLQSLYKGEQQTARKTGRSGSDFAPPLARVFGRRRLEKGGAPVPIPRIGWENTNATAVPSGSPTRDICPRPYANSRRCWRKIGRTFGAFLPGRVLLPVSPAR